MPFRFSLAAVLRYREAIEQRELAALEAVQQEIARIEAAIERTEEELRTAGHGRNEALKRGMRSIQLQDALERELGLERYRTELTNKKQELAIKRLELFKIYDEARQKRELLEKLRDRKLGEYTRAQAKAEQATIDDLFLARRKQIR
jgi:flagellar FliJ protein